MNESPTRESMKDLRADIESQLGSCCRVSTRIDEATRIIYVTVECDVVRRLGDDESKVIESAWDQWRINGRFMPTATPVSIDVPGLWVAMVTTAARIHVDSLCDRALSQMTADKLTMQIREAAAELATMPDRAFADRVARAREKEIESVVARSAREIWGATKFQDAVTVTKQGRGTV